MIAAANRDGYASANVATVIGEARVSRATFYEHFANREECFLAASEEVHSVLLQTVRAAIGDRPPQLAGPVAIETIFAFAAAQPASARFLMSESLAGGALTLDARDRSVAAIAAAVAQAHERLRAPAMLADLPGEILVGASYRLVSSRLRRGERALATLTAGLLEWMGRYERPLVEHRWRVPAASAPWRDPSPLPPGARLRAPASLPPGRPRIPEAAVAENHRLRIMFATAELVQSKGYTATTIAQITKRAGVDGRIFYRMFADKQEAFSAIHELGFQQLMAATAGAFFSAEQWPERLWRALSALATWLELNPAIAHVGFVESYAVGAEAVQRVEDSLIAFTIFLQGGYQHQPLADPPSQLVLEAIVTSVFEVLYRQVRASVTPSIAATLPTLIHLSLTPFLGASETNRFVDRMLAGGKR
jgi:AcrR family transcriptional regulator